MTWRSRRDRDLDDEIKQHLEEAVRDRIERGERPDAAVQAARRDFGNIALVKETTREMWGWVRLDRWLQDLRYGARLLVRNPAFSVVAILSLALGIGANTALFQLLDAVRLRSLPVPHADELVEIRIADMTGARGNFNWHESVTNPIWEQIRDRQQALRGVFAWGAEQFNLTTGGPTRMARGLWVSGAYFDVLGVRPVAGRLLTVSDDQRGCAARAIVSHAFWQREFGGSPSAIGATVTLDAHPVEIVGVTEPRFTGLEVGRGFDVAVPLCADPVIGGGRLSAGTTWWLSVMGRPLSGWSTEQVTAQLRAISPALFAATLPANYPAMNVKHYLGFQLEAISAGTGISRIRNDYERPLWLLLGTAGLVLLIACANLANLLLARASARGREIAMRVSLGASRGRIIRQLLTENLLLASIGAAAGAGLALFLSQSLVTLLDADGNTIVLDLALGWRVLGFTAGIAVLTCLLFGLAPAIRATRLDTASTLRASGRGATAGRDRASVRRALVVCQVALSMVLLVGALLFARTLFNLMRVDPGFNPEGVSIVSLDLRPLTLAAEQRLPTRFALLEKFRAVPGIHGVASASVVPVTGSAWGNHAWMADDPGKRQINGLLNRVSAGYFSTLGIPLVSGRDFDDRRDTPSNVLVAIVNEEFARTAAPGGNVVGRTLTIEQTPNDPERSYVIIGVARNAKYVELREEIAPTVFLATSQDPQPRNWVIAVLRSNLDQSVVTVSIARATAEISPEIAVTIDRLPTVIESTLLRERLMARLCLFFGGLAALLATMGLYGVTSYMVARRTNEIGVRIALGASRRDVAALILRETALLLGPGIALGLMLALPGASLARTLLFGLEPFDGTTFAAAAVAQCAIALVASGFPARRAVRIEPTLALRIE
jgi:putative ABC transport system permease protein